MVCTDTQVRGSCICSRLSSSLPYWNADDTELPLSQDQGPGSLHGCWYLHNRIITASVTRKEVWTPQSVLHDMSGNWETDCSRVWCHRQIITYRCSALLCCPFCTLPARGNRFPWRLSLSDPGLQHLQCQAWAMWSNRKMWGTQLQVSSVVLMSLILSFHLLESA